MKNMAGKKDAESLKAFSNRLEQVWDKVAPNYGWPSVEELSRRGGERR